VGEERENSEKEVQKVAGKKPEKRRDSLGGRAEVCAANSSHKRALCSSLSCRVASVCVCVCVCVCQSVKKSDRERERQRERESARERHRHAEMGVVN
jgi:hypothetical protein